MKVVKAAGFGRPVSGFRVAAVGEDLVFGMTEGDFGGPGQDGGGGGIYAQAYRADGVPDGAEFRVNTYTIGEQTIPAVAMGATGDCVITWQSGGQDGSGNGVYAQRYRLENPPSVTATAVNGGAMARVPNTTNISFDRIEAESLLIALDLEGIAVSTGSACSSGTLEPSHVLKAMGFPPHRTQNSIRFSLGAANTEAEIDRVIAVLPGLVEKLRSLTRAPARA